MCYRVDRILKLPSICVCAYMLSVYYICVCVRVCIPIAESIIFIFILVKD